MDNNTGANAEGADNSPVDSPTTDNYQTDSGSDLNQNPDNSSNSDDAKQSQDSENSDDSNRLDKHPRFQEVIKERNELREKTAEIEQRLREIESQNSSKSQTDSQQKSEGSKNFGNYDDFLDLENLELSFKNPDEYADMSEVFKDMVRPMFQVTMSAISKMYEQNENQRVQQQREVDRTLGEIEKSFNGDQKALDEFYAFATDFMDKETKETGQAPNIWTVKRVYEQLADKGQKEETSAQKKARRDTNSKISKGNTGQSTEAENAYSSDKYRNMDMDEIARMALQGN